MEFYFSQDTVYPQTTLAIGCFEEKILSLEGQEIDGKTKGLLTKVLEANKFKGALGQTLTLHYPDGLPCSRLVLVGLGKSEDLNAYCLEKVGGALYVALANTDDAECTIFMDSVLGKGLTAGESVARIAHGYALRSWRFDDLKTRKKEDLPKAVAKISVISKDAAGASKNYEELNALSEGVFFTRELVTLPPNMLYPESMAKQLKTLEKLGVDVEIMDEAQLKKLGMGALLGVAQGSAFPPYVVLMKWMHGPKDEKPVAFVGKGVTFDSGGLNIKPTGSMEDMKYDMAGAGTVAGLMKTLALRKAPVNVIGAVALVENMVSGNAQRPSDIVTTMSGQTVEVLNTDAEGRLILCDLLWYVQDRFTPKAMIDLATLTGAIIICLGDQYAGLFSNDDDLSERLTKAGLAVHERLWRLPMGKEYDKDIDSDIADVKNIGGGRKAGSITAAQFLGRFTNDIPWAHLDIAGMAWAEKSQPLCEKGASAFGVRLLNQFVKDSYES